MSRLLTIEYPTQCIYRHHGAGQSHVCQHPAIGHRLMGCPSDNMFFGECPLSVTCETKPDYERVPEGVFIKDGCRLCYLFGNNQNLAWDGINSCYSVCSGNFLTTRYRRSPYLIPTTFGELKPGEWYLYDFKYRLKVHKDQSIFATQDGRIDIGYYFSYTEVLRVSEVLP